MLQDIGKGRFDNHYSEKLPQPGDSLLIFDARSLLCDVDADGCVSLPHFGDAGAPQKRLVPSEQSLGGEYLYLFRIGQDDYFLYVPQRGDEPVTEYAPYRYVERGDLRWPQPPEIRYAIQVAYQLSAWYDHNRFCGRCGHPTRPDHEERMLACDACGNMIYPKISPGIIVGIIDGDNLLVTRYNGGAPNAWALVAGFTEIGETSAETVEREVMEEVGLRVKNITYHACQPWPRSSSLLTGFFAELDGSADISVDRSELAEARWMRFDEVPREPCAYSMTREMMTFFVDNHDHPERMIGLDESQS